MAEQRDRSPVVEPWPSGSLLGGNATDRGRDRLDSPLLGEARRVLLDELAQCRPRLRGSEQIDRLLDLVVASEHARGTHGERVPGLRGAGGASTAREEAAEQLVDAKRGVAVPLDEQVLDVE